MDGLQVQFSIFDLLHPGYINLPVTAMGVTCPLLGYGNATPVQVAGYGAVYLSRKPRAAAVTPRASRAAASIRGLTARRATSEGR